MISNFSLGEKVIDTKFPEYGEGVIIEKNSAYLKVVFSKINNVGMFGSISSKRLKLVEKKEPKVSFTKEEVYKALKNALDHWDVECIYDMKGNLNVEFLAGLEIELDKL